MRRTIAGCVLTALLFACALAAGGAASPSSGGAKRAFILDMYQMNDSGLRGRAVLTQAGNDVVVVVDLGPQLPDFYKSYIAEGSCDGHIFDFIYDLGPFRNGVSRTRIQNASVEALIGYGSYMIAVPNGACGDLAGARIKR